MMLQLLAMAGLFRTFELFVQEVWGSLQWSSLTMFVSPKSVVAPIMAEFCVKAIWEEHQWLTLTIPFMM